MAFIVCKKACTSIVPLGSQAANEQKNASLSMLRMSFNLSLPTHLFGNETLMELSSSAKMHPLNSKYVIKNNL